VGAHRHYNVPDNIRLGWLEDSRRRGSRDGHNGLIWRLDRLALSGTCTDAHLGTAGHTKPVLILLAVGLALTAGQ
jgi:hypothetical protein